MAAIDHIGTGRDLALTLAGRFPHQDWVAELAERTHKSRDFVEWHLQEDMAPPDDVLAAAGDMLREQDDDQDGAAPEGGKPRTGDHLPVADLPGNLGKLSKE
ncbi:hypothetical protein [Bosea sp. BK604]|uniref:hypothetical protein n=1 Tax=Bosea sp. BK604 TaxID=2512180 RepID=UPI00104A8E35|nr:hypothetical protein [Bosea sp. BK604]TCR64719.1 hypothetical protein EV560_106185 [Bosea sp. BK604]